MTELYGHKNLNITQYKTGQSCTLFSKAQVCQSLLKIPNAAYPLIPLSHQLWSQSPLVRAVRGSGACMHSQRFVFQNVIKN